jgi:hypothetical protein
MGIREVTMVSLVQNRSLIYPNPVKDGILYIVVSNLNGRKQAKVYDLSRALKFTEPVEFSYGQGKIMI